MYVCVYIFMFFNIYFIYFLNYLRVNCKYHVPLPLNISMCISYKDILLHNHSIIIKIRKLISLI